MRKCITVRLTRWQAAFIAMAAPLHRSPDRPVTTLELRDADFPGFAAQLSADHPAELPERVRQREVLEPLRISGVGETEPGQSPLSRTEDPNGLRGRGAAPARDLQ